MKSIGSSGAPKVCSSKTLVSVAKIVALLPEEPVGHRELYRLARPLPDCRDSFTSLVVRSVNSPSWR
jgi:hypothetical protein